jgi:alpha-L-arabinofuranosidase
MALRKEDMYYNDDQEARNTKRTRITIDVSPELRRRIKMAATQNDLSISEYLGRILDEAVPEEDNMAQEEWQPLSPDILEEVDRLHARVVRESGGHIFEDSAEVLRQQREERTRYLEQLRELQ